MKRHKEEEGIKNKANPDVIFIPRHVVREARRLCKFELEFEALLRFLAFAFDSSTSSIKKRLFSSLEKMLGKALLSICLSECVTDENRWNQYCMHRLARYYIAVFLTCNSWRWYAKAIAGECEVVICFALKYTSLLKMCVRFCYVGANWMIEVVLWEASDEIFALDACTFEFLSEKCCGGISMLVEKDF